MALEFVYEVDKAALALERPALDGLLADVVEPALDLVQPAGAGRGAAPVVAGPRG